MYEPRVTNLIDECNKIATTQKFYEAKSMAIIGAIDKLEERMSLIEKKLSSLELMVE